MDGYAVSAADVAAAPVTLQVVEASSAGRVSTVAGDRGAPSRS